ncbi:MAG: tRNA pseudouridine(54/55) synthase Pus10 [Halobacteriota archaeon]|nr:tRNA pseudouridine(54/55) synthase Pus10 [Halobacteriota archaeon]
MNLIETAIKITCEGPICDSCLGRQFAKLSTGMTNKERGLAIRTVLLMSASADSQEEGEGRNDGAFENLGLPDEGGCWVCNGLMDEIESWADKAVMELEKYDYETFLVGTKITGLISENEEILWAESGTRWAEPLKSELNREVGKLIFERTGKDVDFERPDIVILLNLEEERVDLQINSLFIYGRYRKLIRGIPQTRWFCRECGGSGCDSCGGTGKRYKESVEELISWPSLAEFKGSDASLHGAGREDIDALMLGTGRPFILEIKEPTLREIDLSELQRKIDEECDGKIEVMGLNYTNREVVGRIKSVKGDKVYKARVVVDGAIEKERLNIALAKLEGEIEQKTPIRVLHRRSDLLRKRNVHKVRLISLDGGTAEIEINCEGGLYVKELMSGDEGRTDPSLAGLLDMDVKVSELDVIDVKIDIGVI